MIRAGIVLCGGQSRRMGRPKAWLRFGSEALLSRVVRVMSEACTPLVVVSAAGQTSPPLPPSVEVVHDAAPGRGPLEGLAAGLAALAGRADAAYVSACDAPGLLVDFIRRLFDLLGDRDIAVPKVGGFTHPLAAVYRVGVLDAVRELLGAGQLRPAYLFDRVATRFVAAEEFADIDPQCRSLRNLNTPEDYQAALIESGLGGFADADARREP
jgi:molybdopterin-guanine dinucleotide biosynthesis protein A